MFEGVHVRTARVDLEVCCCITNEAYVCFRRAKDKLEGMPAVIVCVFVCVRLSQQAEWHTAGSVKLRMTYFTINQRLPHSSLRNISNTLPHMLKHMCRARRHHVLWVNYENWLKTFQTISEEGTVKEKNWAPDSPGSSWSGHKSFTMNSKSP